MKSEDITSRRGFIRSAFGIGAGFAAAHLDPAGEPISEAAPVVVVNGDHVVLSGLTIDATGSRRTAIQLNKGVTNGLLLGNTLRGGEYGMKVDPP